MGVCVGMYVCVYVCVCIIPLFDLAVLDVGLLRTV